MNLMGLNEWGKWCPYKGETKVVGTQSARWGSARDFQSIQQLCQGYTRRWRHLLTGWKRYGKAPNMLWKQAPGYLDREFGSQVANALPGVGPWGLADAGWVYLRCTDSLFCKRFRTRQAPELGAVKRGAQGKCYCCQWYFSYSPSVQWPRFKCFYTG